MDDLKINIPVVHELCKWIDDTAIRRQSWVTLAHVLPFLGTVLGRKVALGNLRTNIYCINIAPAGGGKAHAANKIRELCLECQCDALLGSYDVASDSAIEKALLKYPALLCYWDELGFMFKQMRYTNSQYVAKIRPLLMQLYSQANTFVRAKARAMDDNTPTLAYPCFSFCGSSTPNEFRESLSLRELHDGWWSRCLFFWSNDLPPKQRTNADCLAKQSNRPNCIVDFIRYWNEIDQQIEVQCMSASEQAILSPPLTHATINASASDIFRGLDDEAEAKRQSHNELCQLWVRAEENAKRIALILAACENPELPQITPYIAGVSRHIVTKTLNDFEEHVFPHVQVDKDQEIQRYILEIISSANRLGKHCTWRYIVNNTRHSMSRKQRSNAMHELVEGGDVKEVRSKTGSEPYYVAN